MPAKPIQRRFHDYWTLEPNTGCWLWTGKIDNKGYGVIVHNGKMRRAHRMSWELHAGASPGELHVCHHCDVRSCVNPQHLFLGTAKDNVRDCWKKGRGVVVSRRADGSVPTRLRPDDIREIRKLRGNGLTHAAIASRFGIHSSAVSQILSGRNWGYVT